MKVPLQGAVQWNGHDNESPPSGCSALKGPSTINTHIQNNESPPSDCIAVKGPSTIMSHIQDNESLPFRVQYNEGAMIMKVPPPSRVQSVGALYN